VSDFNIEVKYGSTLFGPHRDDLGFETNSRDASHYCSRGDIRSIVVSLKLAEVEYIKKKTGEKPVILLDDIYSELDEKRSKYLSRIIIKNVQSIITSTQKEVVDELDGDLSKTISLVSKKVYA
jgi:DNA replication and repair protein RecF